MASVSVEAINNQFMGGHRNVVFVGPPGVGKTSIIHRLIGSSFSDTRSTTALCVYRFEGDAIDSNGQIVKTFIWDTPGDDRYSWQADRVSSRADLIVFVEGSESESRPAFDRDYGDTRVIKVWNKCDLRDVRLRGGDIIETSALTMENISTLRDIVSATSFDDIETIRDQGHSNHCC